MPNGSDKRLNFVPKIYDTVAQAWKPFYIPPDATDKVQGDVKLSDSIDSDLNAATGMTAASPAAVKAAINTANNKLDKLQSAAQTVTSAVTFNNTVTGSLGFIGNLTGNSTTSTRLQTARNIGIKSGSQPENTASFDGSGNITINLTNLDATTLKGIVPLASIPQGALERVVSYTDLDSAINAYTGADTNNKPFSEGDTVRVTNENPAVMYAVVGDPSSKSSYIEYSAGSAMTSVEAEKLSVGTVGSTSIPVYFLNGVPKVINTIGIENGGTGATTVPNIANNLKYSSIGERINISNNSDLNTYTTSGSYKVSLSSNAKTITNTPKESDENVAFILDVISNVGLGGSAYLRQRLSYYNDFDIWERLYQEDGKDVAYPELTNKWSSWQKAGGSGGEDTSANSGIMILADELQSNDINVGDYIDGEGLTESTNVIKITSPLNTSGIGGAISPYSYIDLPKIKLGAYSIIVRVKADNVIENSTGGLYIAICKSNNSVIKSVSINAKYLSEPDNWECVSFGVNINGTKDETYKIGLAEGTGLGTSIYVDYIRIIPSGTALGSIG